MFSSMILIVKLVTYVMRTETPVAVRIVVGGCRD
nr:MAG TPA: hypothetical protein [Caudoviricetes sp.]